MKFETNFVVSSTNWVKILSNIFLLVSILLIIYIVFMYYQAESHQEKKDHLSLQQQKLEQHIEQQQTQIHQYLSDDQLQQLKKDINTINHVSNLNSLDISSVFYVIELALPKKVNLEQFTYDSIRAESSLAAQSSEPDLLNEFITKLQQDPRFTKIELTDQKQLNIKKSVAFQYQIKIQHKIQ